MVPGPMWSLYVANVRNPYYPFVGPPDWPWPGATLDPLSQHFVMQGCGDTLIQGSGETDAGGNKLLADVGLWLKA